MTPSPRCGTQSDTVATLHELTESKAITVLPIADEERRLLGMVHMHDPWSGQRCLFATLMSAMALVF